MVNRSFTNCTVFAKNYGEQEQTRCQSKRIDSGIYKMINVGKYTSYQKLLRITTFILRFIYNCRIRQESRRQGTFYTEKINSYG